MDRHVNKKSNVSCSVVLAAAVFGLVGAAHGAVRLAAPPGTLPASGITSGTVQSNGMSLSEAVESVRRRGNVERVISAETRVRNGREVHYIRVMTKDGKVQTVQVRGRSRG